jgi:hypothetical protein
LLRSPWFPLLHTFHARQNWLYDICRYANTRRFRVLFDVGANVGQTAERRLERIEVSTVDEFCDRHRIDGIDVLKIDAQGCDLDVLLGAERMISAKRVPFVFVEVGFQLNDIINSPFAPLDGHLTARGFGLCGFYNQTGCGRRNAAPYLFFSDALYSHPDALLHRFSGA